MTKIFIKIKPCDLVIFALIVGFLTCFSDIHDFEQILIKDSKLPPQNQQKLNLESSSPLSSDYPDTYITATFDGPIEPCNDDKIEVNLDIEILSFPLDKMFIIHKISLSLYSDSTDGKWYCPDPGEFNTEPVLSSSAAEGQFMYDDPGEVLVIEEQLIDDEYFDSNPTTYHKSITFPTNTIETDLCVRINIYFNYMIGGDVYKMQEFYIQQNVDLVDDDTTGPEISITYEDGLNDFQGTDGNPGRWIIEGQDPESGVLPEHTIVTIDGQQVSNSFDSYIVPKTLGKHTISVTMMNYDIDRGLDDQETSFLEHNVTILDDDNSGPVIKIGYEGKGNDQNPGKWIINVTDEESLVHQVNITVDLQPYESTLVFESYSKNISISNELGYHFLDVYAINKDNDRQIIDRDFSFEMSFINITDDDNSGPEISINAYGNQNDNSPGFWQVTTFDGQSGIYSIDVYIDNNLVGHNDGYYAVPATLGYHNILVSATNNDLDRGFKDQETSTKKMIIFVSDDDDTGPVLDVSYHGSYTDNNVGYWDIKVFDPESGIEKMEVYIDGNLVGYTNGKYYIPKYLGNHTILVWAINADNDREADQEISKFTDKVEIRDDDDTKPFIQINYKGQSSDGFAGYWNVESWDFESGIEKMNVYIDGILVGSSNGNYSVPNSLGEHSITVHAINADNDIIDDSEENTKTMKILIVDDDIHPPTIHNVSIQNQISTLNISFMILENDNFDDDKGVNVSIYIDGNLMHSELTEQINFEILIPNQWGTLIGFHNLLIIAEDLDNDHPNDSLSFNITKDFVICEQDARKYLNWKIEEWIHSILKLPDDYWGKNTPKIKRRFIHRLRQLNETMVHLKLKIILHRLEIIEQQISLFVPYSFFF